MRCSWLVIGGVCACAVFSVVVVVFVVSKLSVHSGALQWTLVWADEFDGAHLNVTHEWTFDVGCSGWGNHELQCYTHNRPDNVRLEQGNLVIEVRPERDYNHTGHNFTSARIRSRRAWTYGRFEAKARLARGHHLWPAIWMLPRDNKYGGWASSGEIDIMEFRGDRPNETMGTIHYGGQWPNHRQSGSGDRQFAFDLSADFHVYSLEWSASEMRWAIDGKQFHSERIDRSLWPGIGPNPYTRHGQPFDQPFYWIVNVAVGGTFFGPGPYVTVDEAAHWHKPTIELDYLRVYQLK